MFKKVIKFAAYMLAGLNLGVASGLCPMLLAVLYAIGGNMSAAFAINAGVCALIATAVFLVHCRHRSAEKQKPFTSRTISAASHSICFRNNSLKAAKKHVICTCFFALFVQILHNFVDPRDDFRLVRLVFQIAFGNRFEEHEILVTLFGEIILNEF